MDKKEFILNSSKFDTIEGFYIEIEHIFTKNLDFKISYNLDALNDVLYGGFGAHEYDEPIQVIWQNSGKSKIDLCSNFDVIIEIIKEHDNIELVLR